MKTSLLLISCSLFSLVTFANGQPGPLHNDFKKVPANWRGKNAAAKSSDDNWLNDARSFIEKREYFLKNISSSNFAAANRSQKLVYTIASNGYTVEPLVFANNSSMRAAWKASFEMIAAEKGKQILTPSTQPVNETTENRMLQHHNGFEIEYINTPAGLRQNFVIEKRLAGTGALQVTLALKESMLTAKLRGNSAITLTASNGQTALNYDGLKVWDANHRALEAHFQMNTSTQIDIVVNDKNAVYPVTIDPLSHSAEWSSSAQGILPSVLGQLAVDAGYGYSVAGLGDVNGDGFDDVAIGAPAMVDVISGSGHLAAVGAVFVYYGSTNGLSTTPSAELQPSTAVAGALFGFSIAGGDINADGKNDVIVGAPLDKVSMSIGFGLTASGTVGKVYAFSGANLTGAATSPLLTLNLNGSGILEHGVNLSVNALFGYSVAVTEDLNSDGKKDIIVGAPTYAGIRTLFGLHVLDAKSGGAFLFLSDENSDNHTIQALEPPTSSLLGLNILSINIKGMLFGMSVDGAGDYNGDGIPDVVVGAPAGVDLGSISGLLTGQFLQGSAMVFYGNGTGTNAHPGATLVAASGGLLTNLTGSLANVANLFGYSVRSVRNTSGERNGSILVGAPLGGAVTNLLSGLAVKTGTVNVFIKNPGASGTYTPDQSLSSPRNANNILNIIQSSLLFGFSIDNAYDVNCDNIPDIVIGEPASSGAKLLAVNAAGGSAYVFLGKGDGTYQATPSWALGSTYDSDLGVNGASLIGYSVAGAHKVKGQGTPNKILIGTPGRSLDFGTGLLNLGNTFSTLFGLVAGDNGVGKAYLFDTKLCDPTVLPLIITDFNAIAQNNSSVLITWRVSTERNVNAYVIERSSNGSTWETFGLLPASPNTDTAVSFSITDNHPYGGTSYYRIKQQDLDRGVFYTEIKAVNIGMMAGSVRMNNPFNSFVSIQLNASKDNMTTVDLMDITGKTIRHQSTHVSAGMNTIQINELSGLSQGIYLVRIISGNEQYTAKLIKQ